MEDTTRGRCVLTGLGRVRMKAAQLVLLLGAGLGGGVAQPIERPRAYCLNEVDGVCIRGDEYAVERIMPARGYKGQSGQLVAVLGQRFPPPDTNPITCQFDGSAATPARFVSETELQCDVPSQSATGVVSLTLLLDGAAFTDASMFYTFVDAEDDGLVFQGTTLLELVQYVSYGTSTLWFVLTATCCGGYWYRRKKAAANAYRDRRASIGEGTKDSLHAGLLADGKKQQYEEGSEAPNLPMIGSGSVNSEQSTCQKPKCCLCLSVASATLALSSLGTVIFIAYASRDIDLSGGNPEFNTLAVDVSDPSSLELTWQFHTEDPPETLAYEVALQDLTPPARRLRRQMSEVDTLLSPSSVAAAATRGWQIVYFGNDDRFAFADLQASSEYAFRLRFHTNNIPLTWSTASVFETAAATVPATPSVSVITATSANSLTIGWETPLANGAAVSNYEVRVEPGDRTETTAGERVLVFDGLNVSTPYTFEVRAQNSQGWSAWGASVTGTTDATETPTAPAAPEEVALVTATPNTLLVDVGEIEPNSGGAAALAVLLEIDKPEDDEAWIPISAGLAPQTREITGLTASTQYLFRSAVVSSAGPSVYSATVTIQTADASPPLAPPGFTQTTLWSDRADLRWAAAPDGGSPITVYEVSVTNGTAGVDPPLWAENVTAQQLTARALGLSLGGVYEARVRGYNQAVSD
eukprot:COSAG02_NODE_2546_length_8564_cov_4.198346_2_plen_695_part_00